MRWTEGYIAVDWGTTNRRGYAVGADGRPGAEFEDGKGVLSVAPGGFPDAVREIRQRLGDLPLILGGMVGSNRGWVDVPYVPCPADIAALAGGLAWPELDIAIVPGVSFLGDGRADVMRGEEVQLLGAVADGSVPPEALVCHPGTHNKWARVAGGRIVSFRTVMTGELFNLLKSHSILADLLAAPVIVGDAFLAGARHGLAAADLQSELFAIRARVLLGQARREDAASYASGLMIGSDARIGLASHDGGEIVVMGRPELTSLYCAAIALAGQRSRAVDGERSFIAGIAQIVEHVQ